MHKIYRLRMVPSLVSMRGRLIPTGSPSSIPLLLIIGSSSCVETCVTCAIELISKRAAVLVSCETYCTYYLPPTYTYYLPTICLLPAGDSLDQWISKYGWKQLPDSTVFIANQDDIVKTKKITEKISFDGNNRPYSSDSIILRSRSHRWCALVSGVMDVMAKTVA